MFKLGRLLQPADFGASPHPTDWIIHFMESQSTDFSRRLFLRLDVSSESGSYRVAISLKHLDPEREPGRYPSRYCLCSPQLI